MSGIGRIVEEADPGTGVVQRDIELLAGLPGILQIRSRRAVTVIVLPVGHVQGMHVSALLPQQQGGNGGVNAAGQS